MAKTFRILSCLLFAVALFAQSSTQNSAPEKPVEDYSGMYSFLRDGEFVQLTVDDTGAVTGFVSRFGDSDSDRGAFLDQFFKLAKLEAGHLEFTTDTVHGVRFEFKGTVGRGEGKAPSEVAYYVLKGTLTEFRTDADKKVATKPREVTFKSFPQESESTPPARKQD